MAAFYLSACFYLNLKFREIKKAKTLILALKSGESGSNRQPLALKAKALPLSYRRMNAYLVKVFGLVKAIT